MKLIRIFIFSLGGISTVSAHPVPDIPVHSTFSEKTVSIEVMIDPRSFTDDPEGEPYMHFSELGFKDETEIRALKAQGQDLINRTITFQFGPERRVKPTFKFVFTGLENSELKQDTDPVILIGVAKVDVPDGVAVYQIAADENGELSLIFKNTLAGRKVERYMVLFPGETSFELDISQR
jgi:hypothetical protein